MVFKKKSGIVKGLGMRPSSSLVTTASSTSSMEYIHRLESEIIELKEVRARDEEERAKEQEAWAKQDEVQKNILIFWGARVMMMLLPMEVVHLQAKSLIG